MSNEENRRNEELQKDKPKILAPSTDPPAFYINSYWLDYQAHSAGAGHNPTMVLASTNERTVLPYAIVQFHYEADFTQKAAIDHYYPNLFYLHYHISMLEPILQLLNSEKRISCYVKFQGDEAWGGIQLDNTIPVPPIHG